MEQIWQTLTNMTANEIITLIAILVGPVLAVFVTRFVDARREISGRRMDIFRTLMRTRRTPMIPEHVGALNLIEIEFAGKEKVLNAWRDLLTHFGMQHTRNPDEEDSPTINEQERGFRRHKFNTRLFGERQRLLAKLLHAMAKTLRFKAEQLEIFEGGYTPQGWVDIDLQNFAIRDFVIDLALGRKMLPIGVIDYREARAVNEQLATPVEVNAAPKTLRRRRGTKEKR
jgi:hypothetical protein